MNKIINKKNGIWEWENVLENPNELIDGIEDANITINNPFLIELEYEEIENNLLEIDDFFDVIMKQNTL